jgi:NAD(P)-dependent dehydrogenase (short-subunit alcohol dehydrogenase family)
MAATCDEPHDMAYDERRVTARPSAVRNDSWPRSSTAKAAAIGLTKSFGKELAGDGIHVDYVTSAWVAMPLFRLPVIWR